MHSVSINGQKEKVCRYNYLVTNDTPIYKLNNLWNRYDYIHDGTQQKEEYLTKHKETRHMWKRHTPDRIQF